MITEVLDPGPWGNPAPKSSPPGPLSKYGEGERVGERGGKRGWHRHLAGGRNRKTYM